LYLLNEKRRLYLMSFNMIFSFLTLIIIVMAAIIKGAALEKLFYAFVIDLFLVILVNRGVGIALLFVGAIIPLLTRESISIRIPIKKRVTLKGIKQNIISYIAFAPLVWLVIMSYRLPQVYGHNISPVIIVLGELSLVVITFVLIIPKRIKLE